MAPTVKYFNPGTSTWDEISTAGAQGPPGPAGATGPEGPAGTVTGAIDDLTDVNTSTTPPADGESLTWDAGTSQWVPGPGGGGVSAEAGNIARPGVPDGFVFVPDQVVVSAGVAPTDTTPLWVDESATASAAEFLPLTGGTLTGPIVLAADPAAALEAAPKQYVDDLITVSTLDPVAGTDIPARDGLQWIVVAP